MASFSRLGAAELTEKQIFDLALSALGRSKVSELGPVLAKMAKDGHLDYDAKKKVYRLLSYT